MVVYLPNASGFDLLRGEIRHKFSFPESSSAGDNSLAFRHVLVDSKSFTSDDSVK